MGWKRLPLLHLKIRLLFCFWPHFVTKKIQLWSQNYREGWTPSGMGACKSFVLAAHWIRIGRTKVGHRKSLSWIAQVKKTKNFFFFKNTNKNKAAGKRHKGFEKRNRKSCGQVFEQTGHSKWEKKGQKYNFKTILTCWRRQLGRSEESDHLDIYWDDNQANDYLFR